MTGEKAPKGIAPRRVKGVMNKLESKFADEVLFPRKFVGEIKEFWFESDVLELAPRTTYSPDFRVQLPDDATEYYEIKGGHTWEDSIVKLKVAAALYPQCRFYLCKRQGKSWTIRRVE